MKKYFKAEIVNVEKTIHVNKENVWDAYMAVIYRLYSLCIFKLYLANFQIIVNGYIVKIYNSQVLTISL